MNVFLISHIADADGVTPVILTDLAFDNYDYKLLEPSEIDEFMLNAINNKLFDNYDLILVTDLCFTKNIAQVIDQMSLKNKIIVLDHHQSMNELNSYEFINVIDELNEKKESGTSLYYKFLCDKFPSSELLKDSVRELVDLVRSGDTWEWKKTNNLAARDVSTLLANYGNDRFIEKYKKFLRENDQFYFDEIDKIIIEIDRQRIKEYIDYCKDKVIIKDIKGYRVGIIFAELYRSELGNALAEYYSDEVDFIMIINMNRSISFRGIKEGLNLGEFANCLDGRGHKLAAGAPLPDGFKENVIEYVLKKMK